MARSFTWFEKFGEVMEALPDENQAEFALAIVRYGSLGEEPEFDSPLMAALFTAIREDVDNSLTKRASASKGGRPPKAGKQHAETNGGGNAETGSAKPETKPETNEKPNPETGSEVSETSAKPVSETGFEKPKTQSNTVQANTVQASTSQAKRTRSFRRTTRRPTPSRSSPPDASTRSTTKPARITAGAAAGGWRSTFAACSTPGAPWTTPGPSCAASATSGAARSAWRSTSGRRRCSARSSRAI